MKKTTKITITLLLVLAMLVPATVGALAASSQKVQPRWTSIFTIELNMSFDGDEGNATGGARKQSTATNIEGTLTVYKLVGNSRVYIADGYAQKSVGTLIVSVDFYAESGATYIGVFEVTAYTGSAAETETVDVTKTCP